MLRPSGWGMSAGGALVPSLAQVGAEATYSTAALTHITWSFVRTIPADTEYLVIPIQFRMDNSNTGISIASASVGASSCTVLVQYVENDEAFVGCAIIGVASPPSGEQTITITYAEDNARRSGAAVFAVTDFGSIGNPVLATPSGTAAEASVAITPASSPSIIFGTTVQRYDDGLPITPLSGVTSLDEYQTFATSVGFTAFVGVMTAPDATPLDFGATYSATHDLAAAAVEISST